MRQGLKMPLVSVYNVMVFYCSWGNIVSAEHNKFIHIHTVQGQASTPYYPAWGALTRTCTIIMNVDHT